MHTESQNLIDVKAINWDAIHFTKLKRPRGNPHGNKTVYADCITAFDIETSRIDTPQGVQSIMYIWQFQMEDLTVIGRYWEDYIDFLLRLVDKLGDLTLVCHVHNLSYEFQFLKGIYDFENDEVFATDSRQILKCTMFDHIEYRCSYIHSNMSLSKYIESVGAQTHKLDGDIFDYNKVRYPWTELTEYELQYCINDVRGLVEALKIEMKKDGDTLYTLPLTSTGYVRRECKEAMKKYNHNQLQDLLPDADIYRMLRDAFRGGNTHANRFYAGQILHNVNSTDRSSSYPDVLVNYPFPMTKFFREGAVSVNRLIDLIDRQGKAIVMRIVFYDLELTDPFDGCPYLSRSKCWDIEGGIYDNGRILSCRYCETCLTDIDFRIVLNHYKWSACNPYDIATSTYKPLPEPFRDVVRDFYRRKTQLKGEDEYFYMKAKNKLNGLYGMTATDVGKQTILFAKGEYEKENTPLAELIESNNKKAFLSYAWGVW